MMTSEGAKHALFYPGAYFNQPSSILTLTVPGFRVLQSRHHPDQRTARNVIKYTQAGRAQRV